MDIPDCGPLAISPGWSHQTGIPSLDAFFDYIENVTYDHSIGAKKGQPLPDFVEQGWKLDESARYNAMFTIRYNVD